MARQYGRIESAFWTHPDTRKLSDRAKLLATYLLTGPHTNLIACYRLPIQYVSADLGWDQTTVTQTVSELFGNGFGTYDFDWEYVLVTNFLRWNPIDNPNQGKAARQLVAQIPARSMILPLIIHELEQFCRYISLEDLEPFRNGCQTVTQTVTQTVSKPGSGSGSGTGSGTGSGIPPVGPPLVGGTRPPRKTRPGVSSGPRTRSAHRVPDDWQPDPTETGHLGTELRLAPAALAAEEAKFRDHEFRTGHRDWPATWRNWLREAARRGPGAASGAGGPKLGAPERTAIRLQRLIDEGRLFHDPTASGPDSGHRDGPLPARIQRR